MLEPHGEHQGAGLRQARPADGLRLIPLVSQGEERLEQPLLWQLCQALHAYGYPPVVLDGTSRESQAQPGLVDLMQHLPWSALGATEDSDWAVMPAALGLQALAHTPPPQRLEALAGLFQGAGVLVLYARAELLVPLLAGSGVQPVLAVAPGRQALLRGYQTLKQMRPGALVPTLVSLARSSLRNADQLARTTGRNLQQCARTYLGCETVMFTVRSAPQAEHRDDDVHRLALLLLENGAVPAMA